MRRPRALQIIATLFVLSIGLSCSSSPSCASCDPGTESPTAEADAEHDGAEEAGDTGPTDEDWRNAFSAAETSVHTASDGALQASNDAFDAHIQTVMNPSEPLPEKVRQALSQIEFDPNPQSLTRDVHYWVSNENHHHLFQPSIEDHGGILLGVGTDQNYLLAAWARSPILLLMDFDEEIRNVHHLYGINFAAAETPEEFIDRWAPSNTADTKRRIAEQYDGDRQQSLERAHDLSRQVISARLRRTARTYNNRDIPIFLTDQEQYDFIRDLWANGRVFPMRGDLTADTTMVDTAQTLESLGLNLGLYYPSNAEQYFDFTPEYRRNIIAQPFHEDSLVIRTRPMRVLGYPEGVDLDSNNNYNYNIQNANNFAQWLEQSTIPSSLVLLRDHHEKSETSGRSYIREEPPQADADSRPEIADPVGDQ